MHVVFGEIVDGKEVVDKINKFSDSKGNVTQKIIISDCGELDPKFLLAHSLQE